MSKVNVSALVDPEVKEALESLAKSKEWSLSKVMAKALKASVADQLPDAGEVIDAGTS